MNLLQDHPIEIKLMKAQYERSVSELMVHAFHQKLSRLTQFDYPELALFFETLLKSDANGPSEQRVVAIHGSKVVGTLALHWRPLREMQRSPDRVSWLKELSTFGVWNTIKLLGGLHLLKHVPKAGECYIGDLAVHPEYRGMGIGGQLLMWARQYAEARPSLRELSLYVASGNEGAKRLYEQHAFRTYGIRRSMILKYVFRESKWHFMISKL